MKPERVLYICPNGYLGGAEQVVLQLARGHLASGKFRPAILFFRDGKAVEMARAAGIDVSVLDVPFRLSRPLSLFKAMRKIRQVVKSLKPAIIHLTMPYSHLVVTPAISGLGCRTVWFQHGPVGGWMDRAASLIGCDAVLFNSSFTEECHRKLAFRKPRSTSKVIPMGVAPAENVSSGTALGLGEREITIGTAGRICDWKGQDVFIRAIAKLRALIPERFTRLEFVIFGAPNREPDKPYFESLKTAVKDLRLENDVRFLGFRENLGDYLAEMDIFIHSSRIPEPFGLVVGEAMLAGALVIGSSSGGVTEILKDGETGFTYDSLGPGADERLAEAMKAAIEKIESPEIREMKARARSLVANRFSNRQMTNAVENVYTELL